MQAILLDLDGVVYNAEEPIEGAAETVSWLQSEGIPHLFVTNTTSRGRLSLVEKLQRFGIQTGIDQILTPCSAAADWLKTRGEGPVALFVKQEAMDEFSGLDLLARESEAGARYIVIGDLGETWNFETLNKAFRLLHLDSAAELVALGMTRFWYARDGLRLDVAPFIAALECATGKKALVFGKPSEAFYGAAAKQLGIAAPDIVMVGDGIDTDVAGARKAGMKGVLVRTGKFSPSDLEGTVKPDAILHSIRDLPDYLKTSNV
jgi:phospholysine phosphohistidine inorganic pyrophosphate phosphatase